MSAQPLPTPALTAPNGPGQHAGNPQHLRAVLLDLVDMGHDLARMVHAQARAQAETASTPEPSSEPPSPAIPVPTLAAAFDRIARCVRRTVLLVQHLDRPPKPAGEDRLLARKRILRRCEDHIALAAFNNRKRPGRIDAGALHAELLERLDSPELAEDLDNEIATRPIPDIITDICRDLGLGLDDMPGCCPAPRRTPRDIANLLARAAATPGTSPRPLATQQAQPQAAPQAAPTLAHGPDDPLDAGPDMDDMLALCAALVRDG